MAAADVLTMKPYVQMAQKAPVWDLGFSSHPTDRACPQKMVGGKRLLRPARYGRDGFSQRDCHARLQSPCRIWPTALVQTGAGLPDWNRGRRLPGMAEPEVGREESRRASQPRLEVSRPFGEHQDSDRVAGMAGQRARSQTR